MPGVLKTREVADDLERCEGERGGGGGEGVTVRKEMAGHISNGAGKGEEEERGEEGEGSSTTCSTPDAADLDNSSSTVASTEGDSDSKNGDSPPSSLVNPLPDGSDQNELDDGSKQSGGAASKTSVSGGSLVKQQSSLPLNSEISMVTLRLALPGVSQPVEVVMSTRDTVHDLSQLLLERAESCYRTCTSAWHNKKRLDDFCELGMVEDLGQGDPVELIEEPYTQKDIRIHLQRLRELLTVSPLQQSLTNADGMSLSLISAITLRDSEEMGTRPRDDFVDLSQLEPPSHCLPRDGTTPLSAFYPSGLENHFKVQECVRLISYSPWNPPPSHRRMKGDLLYLDVVTLEGVEHFVTACPSGFFLNRSTARDAFDPAPKKTAHHHKHLVGLLSVISPLFKKNFALLQKFGEKRHPYELLPSSYPLYPWLAPRPEHKPSPFRLSDGMQLKAAPDEVIMGQMRDWNEELQSARELPTDTPQLKLFRDRTIYKIHCDLVQVATRGAMLAVDGFIPALNPGDQEKFRMFLWNNLFFSLAFDGRDHYKAYGGDEAAHAAASGDLHGVEMFERLETKDLYTLQTVIVDYRGYRVVCQSIVPGLLWREQEAAVMYGSIDGGKTIGADPTFTELLSNAASDLHIRPHKLKTESGEIVELPSSLEVKGILGTDSRRYALDLFRIFPPDANHTPLEEEEGEKGEGGEKGEKGEGGERGEKGKGEGGERGEKGEGEGGEWGEGERKKGFRHKLAVLRPELLETFLQYRYLLFLKLAKERACKLQVIQDLHQVLQHQEKDSRGAEDKTSSKSVTQTSTDKPTSTTAAPSSSSFSSSVLTSSSSHSSSAMVTGAESGQTPAGAEPGQTPAELELGQKAAGLESGQTETSMESGQTSGGLESGQTGIESGQSSPAASATVVTGGKCPFTNKGAASPDSRSSGMDSSPSSSLGSSPGTWRLADTSLSRLTKGGAGGVGRTNMSILTALGAGGGGGGGEEGGSGEGGARDLGTTAEGEEGGKKEDLPAAVSLNSSANGEVLLVDGLQLLVEEKEVGPEVLPGADLLPTSDPSDPQQVNLEKGLNTSEILKTHPEVMSALREAALEAGSVEGEEFDIRFNVDALSPGVSHADPPEVLERDRKLLRETASFLTDVVIPRMVRECVQLTLVPTDGESLKTAMHARGINMRYLGRIATLASSREDLEHLKRLSVSEMVVRVAKRRLRRMLHETPYEKVSEAIAHFLNCFLGQTAAKGGGGRGHVDEAGTAMVNGHSSSSSSSSGKKKQKKKRNSKGRASSEFPHLRLSPANLWSHVVEEVENYYKYSIEQPSAVELCSALGVQRVVWLGELCRKTGIQMVALDYDFTSRTPFTEDDIASLFPIVKHTNFRSTECAIMYELAQTKFSAGSFRTAHDLYMESLQMFIQIYGPLHICVANCYRQVAKINYMVGEVSVALSFQHKAVLVYERVLGVDHPETLTSYINLAIYCHNTNQTAVALRLMYRARYLLTLMCGEDHPEVATCDCNIALMLHGFKQYERSLKFLENSLRVFEKYHGKQSLQAALTHHLMARVQSFLGDFRAALQNEKSTYSIYNSKFGSDHERTKESSECLKDLTQKAVTMQKTINEMTGKSKGSGGGKVLVELPGSWGDVASMINAPQPRQKPTVTKTHVIRRRNKLSKQQQTTSQTTKPTDKQPPSTATSSSSSSAAVSQQD